MEEENLQGWIYAMSQTPNITFAEMKGLGALSGIALKLLFMDAHMAVKNKEEVFGLGLQRRLNLLKAAIGLVVNTKFAKLADMTQVKPVLTPYLPMNETETIDNISSSIQSGIMSKETALENHPMIVDVKTELERLAQDQQEAMTAMQEQAGLAGGGFQDGNTGEVAAGTEEGQTTE
jgi:SPP1 family phage portal protein